MRAFILLFFLSTCCVAQQKTVRELGIKIGNLEPGEFNAITDVSGVMVGHTTLIEADSIRTGVTAILPHGGNIFMHKVPAAIYIGNAFGKLIGYTQVEELGEIETPIILTNTLSVPTAANALIGHVLSTEDNIRSVRSVNPVVGETNDGALNDIQGRHVSSQDVIKAIEKAGPGLVKQGAVGAGTGTICFGYKGGIGTSSRVLSEEKGGYTIGVLVQSNYGGRLTVAGIPVGDKLKERKQLNSGDGSCMIVIATDAPLTSRNLKRLAKRAMFGIAKTGGNASNGSGEYVIAFSTAKELRIPYSSPNNNLLENKELRNDRMTPIFEAVIETTEEAILNSLFMAETMSGRNGLTVERLPVEEVLKMLKE